MGGWLFPCHIENELSFPHTSVVLCPWPLKSQSREKEFTPPTCTAASLGEKTPCSESNCWGKNSKDIRGICIFVNLSFSLEFSNPSKRQVRAVLLFSHGNLFQLGNICVLFCKIITLLHNLSQSLKSM